METSLTSTALEGHTGNEVVFSESFPASNAQGASCQDE